MLVALGLLPKYGQNESIESWKKVKNIDFLVYVRVISINYIYNPSGGHSHCLVKYGLIFEEVVIWK